MPSKDSLDHTFDASLPMKQPKFSCDTAAALLQPFSCSSEVPGGCSLSPKPGEEFSSADGRRLPTKVTSLAVLRTFSISPASQEGWLSSSLNQGNYFRGWGRRHAHKKSLIGDVMWRCLQISGHCWEEGL